MREGIPPCPSPARPTAARATLVAVLTALWVGSPAWAADTLLGTWRQNPEESTIDAPKIKGGAPMLGGGRTTIVIGGFPIPGSRPKNTPSGSPKNPDVLFCQTMTIEEVDDRVRMTYDLVGTRDFVPGNYRGRTTKYSKKRLIEYYETMSRSVEQKYVLENKNRLVVTVVIKPKGVKKTTYRRVFERQETGDG